MKKFMYLIFVLFILCLMSSCAHSTKIVRIPCPPRPEMVKVVVKDGTITGESLDAVIENHQRVWEYVHKIEKLGCTR